MIEQGLSLYLSGALFTYVLSRSAFKIDRKWGVIYSLGWVVTLPTLLITNRLPFSEEGIEEGENQTDLDEFRIPGRRSRVIE